jgi:hypothetical protein
MRLRAHIPAVAVRPAVLAIAAVWLCFQDTPSVVRSVQLTPQDIENAKRLIERHDPRKADHSGPRTVAISEQELDLMLNYAASHFGSELRGRRCGPPPAAAAAEIARSPFGRYVNVDATLRETGGLPRRSSSDWQVEVPATIADYLLREACGGWRRPIAGAGRRDRQGASFANGRLTVTYVEQRNPRTACAQCCSLPRIRRVCARITTGSSRQRQRRRTGFRSPR